MSSLSISRDNDTDSTYTGYSANGSFSTSIITGTSSGGARLSAAPDDDESGWQNAPGTRARRGVASSIDTNTSGVSTASTSIITNPPRARAFDKNAYGKPKSTASITSSAVAFNWMNPPRAAPSTSNGKFAKVKAYKSDEEKRKTQEAFESVKPESEVKILDREWDSDVSSSQDESDSEDDDDDTE
jgi:hypothetical protein